MGNIIDQVFGGGLKKQGKKSLALTQDMYNDSKAVVDPWSKAGSAAYDLFNKTVTGSDDTGYKNYLNSNGYKAVMGAGTDAIENSKAASGMLHSGATLKAMNNYGQQMGDQYYQNYLGNLQSSAQIGLGGVQALVGLNTQNAQAQAAQRQAIGNAQGQGVGNMLNFGLGIAGLSDRRLKTDIVKVGEAPDGLGYYLFNYVGLAHRWLGVMADEVAKLRPWAVGPTIDGYASVNYGRL